jgi:PAS domain S-box-containing protein
LKDGFSTGSDNLNARDFMEKGIDLTLFRAIAEQASDAIIFVDARGVVRFWNDSAKAVFGYTAGEALGCSLDLIIPERLRQAHWDAFQRAIETGQTRLGRQAFATRAVPKDGHRLYVELSFAVIKDMAGKVAGALGIARDITSRYVSEAALRKRLSFLEGQPGQHQIRQKQR